LYHTHYREYDWRIQRWDREDPAGYVDGLNLYAAYFDVNGVDPDGRAVSLLAIGGYLAYSAITSIFDTAVEESIDYALTGEGPSVKGTGMTYLKNFAINTATAGLGTKIKTAKNIGTVGKFALGYGADVDAGTVADATIGGENWGDAFLGNAVGSGVGRGVGKGLEKSFHYGIPFKRSDILFRTKWGFEKKGMLTNSEFDFIRGLAKEKNRTIVMSGSLTETATGIMNRYNPDYKLPVFRDEKRLSGLIETGEMDVDIWEGSKLSQRMIKRLRKRFE
jgi:hypothetical protein